MSEKGNGGSQGPFQDTPIFGGKRPKIPGLPKLPDFKLPLAGRRPAALIVAVLIITAFVYNLLLVYVGPSEYGIKQVKIGINRGIQEKVYTTGLHLVLPGMEAMHTFPRNLQVFELNNYPTQYTRLNRYEKAAYIQTSDGFFVDVDVAIMYRIVDPYLLITTVGPGRQFEDGGIIPKAEPVLKEALGELSTEEFYNSPLRVEKTMKAREMLSKELQPYGIEVDEVLVRYFTYSVEFQKNFVYKKLQDQLVF
jgi:regulator of protease activity HflC (stomatin/prohibitin superfamily)